MVCSDRWWNAHHRKRLSLLARLIPVVLGLLFWLFPVAGLAHSGLDKAVPAPGARLDDAPAGVELRFGERLESKYARVQLLDVNSKPLQLGTPQIGEDGQTLRAALPSLQTGIYTVIYEVMGVDGHPVKGRYSFGIGVATSNLEAPAAVTLQKTTLAASLARGAYLVSSLSLAGLIIFLHVIWAPAAGLAPAVRRSAGFWSVGLALTTLISAGLDHALYVAQASGGPTNLVGLVTALFDTTPGQLTALRCTLTVLLAAATVRSMGGRLRWGRPVTICLAALLTAATGFQGHNAATTAGALSGSAHVAAAAVWIGGLIGFGFVVRSFQRAIPPEEAIRLRRIAVRRFTMITAVSVLVLAATGLYAATAQIPNLDALVTTAYGRALTIKLALLMPVLALGGYHALRGGGPRFSFTVAVEAGLVIAIFGAVGYLTTSPPARVELAVQGAQTLAQTPPLRLQSSWPGPSQTLQEAPRSIEVRLSGALDASQSELTLHSDDGALVPGGQAGTDAENGWMWFRPPALAPGKYHVQAHASDAAGQMTESQWEFSVAGQAPQRSGWGLGELAAGIGVALAATVLGLRWPFPERNQSHARPHMALHATLLIGLAAALAAAGSGALPGLHPASFSFPTAVKPGGERTLVAVQFNGPIFPTSGMQLVAANGVRVHPGVGSPVPGDRSAWQLTVPALRPGPYQLEWDAVSAWNGHRVRGSYAISIRNVIGDDATSNAGAGHLAHVTQNAPPPGPALSQSGVPEGATPAPAHAVEPLAARMAVEPLSAYRLELSAQDYTRRILDGLSTVAELLLAAGAVAAFMASRSSGPADQVRHGHPKQGNRKGPSPFLVPRWAGATSLALHCVDLWFTWQSLQGSPLAMNAVVPAGTGPWQGVYMAVWLVKLSVLLLAVVLTRQGSGGVASLAAIAAVLIRGMLFTVPFAGPYLSSVLTGVILTAAICLVGARAARSSVSGPARQPPAPPGGEHALRPWNSPAAGELLASLVGVAACATGACLLFSRAGHTGPGVPVILGVGGVCLFLLCTAFTATVENAWRQWYRGEFRKGGIHCSNDPAPHVST